MEIASHPELSQALADALANGPIPFRCFMEIALYHPTGGYYCRPGARVGPDGDFYTSPHQSPWLGRMIAPLLEKIWRRMGDAPALPLWEYGPGEGWLALDILESLRSSGSDLREAIAYRLAEQSAQARARMRERLRGLDNVRFVDAAQYPPAGFEGVVLAHEFLDALPVHALVQRRAQLRERYVTRHDARLRFSDGPLSDARLGRWFSDLGVRLSVNQLAEAGLCAFDWVREAARRMERGALLIFDYGFSASVLHDAARPEGTLRGYRNHNLIRDPLSRPGETDLTAHLDFTSILRAAASGNMTLAGFTDQTHFLLGAGLPEAAENAMQTRGEEETRRERQGILGIMNPAGMGGAIKVMLLSKGLGEGDFGGAFSMKPDDRASYETLAG